MSFMPQFSRLPAVGLTYHIKGSLGFSQADTLDKGPETA